MPLTQKCICGHQIYWHAFLGWKAKACTKPGCLCNQITLKEKPQTPKGVEFIATKPV